MKPAPLYDRLAGLQAALQNGDNLERYMATLHACGDIITLHTDGAPLHFRRSYLGSILAHMEATRAGQAKPATATGGTPRTVATSPRAAVLAQLQAIRAAVLAYWQAEGLQDGPDLALVGIPATAAATLRKPFRAAGATLKVLKGRPAMPPTHPAVPDQLQVTMDLQGTMCTWIMWNLDAVDHLVKQAQRTHRTGHGTGLGSAPARAVGNFTTQADRERTLQALRDNLATAKASGHQPLVDVMAKALATAMARPVDPR